MCDTLPTFHRAEPQTVRYTPPKHPSKERTSTILPIDSDPTEDHNLMVNSSPAPRRLASGFSALYFSAPSPSALDRSIRISLCLTSEARGYVEFRPESRSTSQPSPIRLPYEAGKNNLSYVLDVVPSEVDGYRLYLPTEFGSKTVWCEAVHLIH